MQPSLNILTGLALLVPLAAHAQFAEPEIRVQRLSEKEHPAIAEEGSS